MALQVPDYPDGYLKELWFVIQRRKAAGLKVDDTQESEIKAEMIHRGFIKE